MRTTKHIRRAGMALMAVAALALSGCSNSGDNDSDDTSTTAAELPASDYTKVERDQLEDGGTLRMAVSELPTSWNQWNSIGNNVDLGVTMAPFILPQNWIIGEDASYEPNPTFIKDYKISDDGLDLTINLNDKAVWNNGTSITAADYVATWKANNGSNADFDAASTDGWTQMTDVAAGDSEFQVKVKFKAAYPDWAANFSTVAPAAGVGDPDTFNDGWNDGMAVVDWFTGPFIVTDIDQSAKLITLEKNPNWWGDEPKLDKVTFKALDPAATAQAFANNELDIVDGIIDADTYQLVQKRSDATLKMSDSVQWRHFTFNSRAGVLKDKAIRQAIQKGINTADITASDLAGMPTADMDMHLGNHFFMPSQEGYEDNSVAFDPDGAKADIEALGYTMNETSGYYEKDGTALSFKYLRVPEIPTSNNEGVMLQSQMKDIGIKVDFDDITSKDLFKRITPGEFEVTTFAWQGTPFPMANVGQIYGTDSGSNFSGYSDPKIDEYITKIATETDHEKRVALANEVDKVIWDDVMTLPIYYRAKITAVPSNLANFGASAFEWFKAEDIGYTK